jgi:UDPglucose 6-dehydrogenase
MKIGIIGNGYVGKATSLLFMHGNDVIIYDKDPSKSKPTKTQLADIAACDLIFICVPTPMYMDGSCDTDIISAVISSLKGHSPMENIIIRSTVPVGFSDSFGVNFMPEFLTERNWKNDIKNTEKWIVGTANPSNTAFKKKIKDVISKEILFILNSEAEMVKLVRNAFLATKVSFFNEMENFCTAKKVDFDVIREVVTADRRIGEDHSFVPGPDGKRGFGGTCLPKDLNSLSTQMEEKRVKNPIIDSVINRNEMIDRPEKDWENDKGRAVS